MPDNQIAQARHERGWSQLRLLGQLRLAPQAAGIALPDDAALRITLSGWENGHHRPGKVYQRLLCHALELTESDLGFGSRPVAHRSAIRPEAIAYLNAMLQLHTRADQVMGSRLLVDVVREQTRQAEQWTHEARGPVHQPLVATVSQYAEFCGWLHQDQGDFAEADAWTRRSVEMAQELGDDRLVAYGLMRRSNIATESSRPTDGLHLAEAALRQRHQAEPRLTALALRQKATAHALLGEVGHCRARVDRGTEAVAGGAEADHWGTEYCTTSYMAMEGGQAMLLAGNSRAAVQLLTSAVDAWPAGQDRDKGLCLARLANAYIEAGEPEAACEAGHAAIVSLTAAVSARTLGALRRLRGRLVPYRTRHDVMDLREELARAV
jgi:transcriptional regulator with XRE-family HTH domain